MAKKLGFVSLSLLICALSFAQSSSLSGRVTISYTFSQIARIASNQYAIWVEDEKGTFIRTLFVTRFASRGWKFRPQAVPTWARAANIQNLPEKDIDAISGATPSDGSYEVVWDLHDSKGQLVSAGRYRYFLEGNIYWDNRVLWSGTITVGSNSQMSHATATFSTVEAEKIGSLISEVSASYTP